MDAVGRRVVDDIEIGIAFIRTSCILVVTIHVV